MSKPERGKKNMREGNVSAHRSGAEIKATIWGRTKYIMHSSEQPVLSCLEYNPVPHFPACSTANSLWVAGVLAQAAVHRDPVTGKLVEAVFPLALLHFHLLLRRHFAHHKGLPFSPWGSGVLKGPL